MKMSKNWGPGDSEIDVDEWWRLCCERRECKWLSNWATKAYKLDHSLPEHCSALLMTMMLTKKGGGKGSQVCAQLVAAQTRPQLQLLSHLWPHHLPSPMSKHLLFYHSDADYFNSPELCPEPFVNEDDEEEEWQRDEKSHLVQGVLLLPMKPLKNCEILFLKITKKHWTQRKPGYLSIDKDKHQCVIKSWWWCQPARLWKWARPSQHLLFLNTRHLPLTTGGGKMDNGWNAQSSDDVYKQFRLKVRSVFAKLSLQLPLAE